MRHLFCRLYSQEQGITLQDWYSELCLDAAVRDELSLICSEQYKDEVENKILKVPLLGWLALCRMEKDKKYSSKQLY